jgi:hypothetical protein
MVNGEFSHTNLMGRGKSSNCYYCKSILHSVFFTLPIIFENSSSFSSPTDDPDIPVEHVMVDSVRNLGSLHCVISDSKKPLFESERIFTYDSSTLFLVFSSWSFSLLPSQNTGWDWLIFSSSLRSMTVS